MDDRPNDGAIAHNPFADDRPIEGLSASMLRWFGLFHTWDFIYSDLVEGKPEWKTEKRHPLNATTLYGRWKRHDQLIGVRFPTKRHAKTTYFMADIDRKSQYHPYIREDGVREIIALLEAVGVCRFLRIGSSDSGGIHLYFPFPKAVLCHGLAVTIHKTLEQQGFEIAPGQLEIFPNLRSSSDVLYRGHRLPLQSGSYVLDDTWQPLHNSLEQLIESWDVAASCQDTELLEKAIALNQVRKRYTSKDYAEWKLRLETTLQNGWTGEGQTNDIVRDLCIYARVFLGKDWNSIKGWAAQTATELPGYKIFCRHQHEIQKRVRDWVRTNRKSNRYRPVGSLSKKSKAKKKPNNQEKKDSAYQRIQEAIATLIEDVGALPSGAKERQRLICEKAACSATTLYLHKKLWHPDFDGKVSVTPDSVKLSVALDKVESSEESYLACVTVDVARVSAIAKESLNSVDVPEALENQRVTHPTLLSVNSLSSSEEAFKASEVTLQLKPNDLVRWKRYDAIFQVRKVSSNGTVWAKRLHHPVQLVDAVLKVNELELIQPQDMNSNRRREANGL